MRDAGRMGKTLLTTIVALALLGSANSMANAANYYGAIAISPSTHALGWAFNHRSRANSEQAALANCEDNAGDCRIAIWFRNACGAIATGNGGWGAAWATNRNGAIRRAIAQCSSHAGNCQWKQTVCTAR